MECINIATTFVFGFVLDGFYFVAMDLKRFMAWLRGAKFAFNNITTNLKNTFSMWS